MLLAEFIRGPFDGKRLILPTEEPWPKFVIPRFDSLLVETFYLYAGKHDRIFLYLYDEFFGTVMDDPDELDSR